MTFSATAFADVDAALPDYQKASGVSGKLPSVGSDTLANLMTLWAEEFKREYPNVSIQIQAAGSSTAPPALTEGTASFGPMSRKMKDKEIGAFESKFGYKPTPIRVAIDALAVYTHKDNPLEGAECGVYVIRFIYKFFRIFFCSVSFYFMPFIAIFINFKFMIK